MFRLSKKHSIYIAVGILLLFFASMRLLAPKTFTPSKPRFATHESNNANTQSETSSNASMILGEFNRSEVKDGKTIWEIRAKEGQYSPENGTAKLKQNRLILNKKVGQHIELTSDEADIRFAGTELNNALLNGNVVLIYNKQVTLRTSKATFTKEQDAQIVRSPQRVSISSETTLIEADDLFANVDKEEIIFTKNVKTTIYPNNGKK